MRRQRAGGLNSWTGARAGCPCSPAMDQEPQRQREELRALRAEIAALRRCLEPTRPAAAPAPGPAPDSDRHVCQESHAAPAGGDLETQLGRLESEVAFLSKLTGIRMTDYSMTRVELPESTEETQKNEQRVLRKGRLAGGCRAITFQLEFQLLETRTEDTSSTVLTDLSIIMEPMEHSELNRFVTRAEEKRDLFLFFRSLHFFLEWCEYRRQTFQYFKEKHPAVVQLPGGLAADCMKLQSPRVPGFEFVVVWMVHIEEEGKVVPKLDLLTKIPERALILDEKKVAEQAPHCFRTLLQLLGIEAAIENLIELLSAHK
ncbi:centromere protein P [Dromiciops gliroides]|uniref:centromere protein P n=1 Tax=Dromiciops gliroides TaxID=33562 RepID=UPI001CC6F95F|nr:centromere protein P [Dromiciops gliroides]